MKFLTVLILGYMMIIMGMAIHFKGSGTIFLNFKSLYTKRPDFGILKNIWREIQILEFAADQDNPLMLLYPLIVAFYGWMAVVCREKWMFLPLCCSMVRERRSKVKDQLAVFLMVGITVVRDQRPDYRNHLP